MKYLHANPRLESGDLPANCTVSHMKFVRSSRETVVPRRGFKGA